MHRIMNFKLVARQKGTGG